MRPPSPEPPPGFVRFRVNRSEVTCVVSVADALRDVLGADTLYEFAARQPDARPLTGRGVVYALSLPHANERVVVRRNRHGGLLGQIRGDLFLPPTRAPRELNISERLRQHGVPTPQMLGYVLYDAPAGLLRADVMTREVANAIDLSTPLQSPDAAERVRALSGTAQLVTALSNMGARHRDLNVKNVLLGIEDLTLRVMVLDVDRVTFPTGSVDVLEQNLARLLRSARKWQQHHGARVTEPELAEFAALVRGSRL
jgi:tRNA A-37 threonylcarbamoyl transferase component Bud32